MELDEKKQPIYHSLICRSFHNDLADSTWFCSCLATLATRKADLSTKRVYSTSSVGAELGEGRKQPHQTSPTSALFSGELTPTTAKVSPSHAPRNSQHSGMSEKPLQWISIIIFHQLLCLFLPCSSWVNHTAWSLHQAPQHHPHQRNRDN